MAEYGIATYDANGNYNNYGIRPVTVVDVVRLSAGQVSGSYSYTIPAGTKLGYAVGLDAGATGAGRRITVSGNTMSVSPASAPGNGVFSASLCNVVLFLERA